MRAASALLNKVAFSTVRTREARIWDQCLFSPLSPLFALCHGRQTDRVPSTKGATAWIDMLDEETSPRCTREEPHRYILEHPVQEHTVRSSPTDDFVHTSRPPESRCSPHEESLTIISAKRPESPRFVLVQGAPSDRVPFLTTFVSRRCFGLSPQQRPNGRIPMRVMGLTNFPE